MAMAKAVIASNVKGLQELVKNENTGLLFNVDDGEHLVAKCIELIENPSLLQDIGHRAREWVRDKRDWRKIITKYREIYSEIVSRKI